MKLKLLIVITVLAVIGIVVIAVVKKSNSVPVKPEITEITTGVQVEMKPTIMKESMGTQTQPAMDGGNDEKIKRLDSLRRVNDTKQTQLLSSVDSLTKIFKERDAKARTVK